MLRLNHFILIAVVIAPQVGCENTSEPLTTGGEPESVAQAETASDSNESNETVASGTPPDDEPKPDREEPEQSEPVATIAEWDEIIKTVTASNKPAVLDVWSLVCQPCLEEFPGLVRLHKDFGDHVACFSADVDFDGRKTRPPETYQPRVDAFLQQVGAAKAFPHFISATASDDVYSKLDIDSIPTVVVFDKDGRIAKKFVDAGETAGFTYDEDVIPFVKSLLADD